jgi:hypothetical protein
MEERQDEVEVTPLGPTISGCYDCRWNLSTCDRLSHFLGEPCPRRKLGVTRERTQNTAHASVRNPGAEFGECS